MQTTAAELCRLIRDYGYQGMSIEQYVSHARAWRDGYELDGRVWRVAQYADGSIAVYCLDDADGRVLERGDERRAAIAYLYADALQGVRHDH